MTLCCTVGINNIIDANIIIFSLIANALVAIIKYPGSKTILQQSSSWLTGWPV